ncbi:MAG: hypothetical protein R2797_07075 [Gelidibacter sp.]
MIKKFILHIGPGKCGSSSIQNFFKSTKNPSKEKIGYVLLKPKDVNRFNKKNLDKDSIVVINDILQTNGKNCDILILSRENLYQCPFAIANIFKESSKKFNENILIGYSRRQSDFFVSAYSQWFFRSDESISESNTILFNLGLHTDYFTSMEKQLIAGIGADFKIARHFFGDNLMDWNEGYQKIKVLLDEKIKLRMGTLPTYGSDVNLIQDFCDKAGINLKQKAIDQSKVKINAKFNPSLVEALNVSKEIGLSVINPHEENDTLLKISNQLKSHLEIDTILLENILEYIDFYFLESNLEFCKKYNLDASYFNAKPSLDKSKIIELFKEKESNRKSSAWLINYYKNLSAVMLELNLNSIK